MDWPGLFSGIGGAGIVVAVAAWLLRTYGDRLITHKFDKERLSFEKRLDLSLAEHSSATTSMAASQEAAFQRELAAMETLWRSVVDIRSKWPSIMTWLDMLTRDECVELFEKGSLQSLKLPNLDDVDPIEVLGDPGDRTRIAQPFVEQRLYNIFWIYRAFTGRIVFLVRQGIEDGKYRPWVSDRLTLHELKTVFTDSEFTNLVDCAHPMLSRVFAAMEFKMIECIRRSLSGEQSGESSLETAMKLSDMQVQHEKDRRMRKSN